MAKGSAASPWCRVLGRRPWPPGSPACASAAGTGAPKRSCVCAPICTPTRHPPQGPWSWDHRCSSAVCGLQGACPPGWAPSVFARQVTAWHLSGVKPPHSVSVLSCVQWGQYSAASVGGESEPWAGCSPAGEGLRAPGAMLSPGGSCEWRNPAVLCSILQPSTVFKREEDS